MAFAERLLAVKDKYILSPTQCHKIRRGMVEDMQIGIRTKGRDSSCKMLESHVKLLPNGQENGIFYAIDFGGSNVRFIRMRLTPNKDPQIDFMKKRIPKTLQTTNNVNKLFNFLADGFKQHMISFNEYSQSDTVFSVGFTFSFPIKQPSLNKGILVEWTKGFNINGVVGKDIAKSMNDAFVRYNIPARIDAIFNDTVGTLISCSYDNPNTFVGIIIGTGANAAYFDEEMNEVINMEWGNFDEQQKYLSKVRETDVLMDSYTPNEGLYVAEKMLSGLYCGEVCRILMTQIFKEKIPSSGSILLQPFGEFSGYEVTKLMKHYYDNDEQEGNRKILKMLHSEKYNLRAFDDDDIKVMIDIFKLVLNRSADLAAAMLLGVLQKIGVFEEKAGTNEFMLNEKYKYNPVCVGVDGGLFLNMPQYPQRIRQKMVDMVGEKIVNWINIVHSEDGSGRGAALCVAALRGNNQISSKL